MSENKVKYGLKNAHYAKIQINESGVVTFATPVALKGAVNLKISPKGDAFSFYADNEEFLHEEVNNGYEGELELALINDEFRRNILGEELDNKGVQFENNDAKANKFALLYQFEGDIKETKHVLYFCTATRPEDGSTTKNENKDIQTETLKFTANNIPGTNHIKAKTSSETDEIVYNNWFTEVHEYEQATNS